jgi:hypothetical protein
MSNDNFFNPYSPSASFGTNAAENALGIPNADLKKAEAIIKDAGQFWLAILICFLCSALGMIVIGPWYLRRLIQWNGLASKYPSLMQPTVEFGSLPQRFQSSKWKLITGLVVGLVLFLLLAFLIFVSIGTAALAKQQQGGN